MTRCAGIDPDCKTLAWALVDDDHGVIRVVEMGIVRCPGGGLGMGDVLRDTLAKPHTQFIGGRVELPVPSRQGRLGQAPLKDIRNLSAVAGQACFWLHTLSPMAEIGFCEVNDWKGQAPKVVTQRRIAKRLGWSTAEAGGKDPYCYPTDFGLSPAPIARSKVNRGDWKHLFDGVGVALYAYDMAVRKSRMGL